MIALPPISLDANSAVPVYKQLAEFIRGAIRSGALENGTQLPTTRGLAGQLGLNRTTVSAAYRVLEEAGLLQGKVGRGSFVASVHRPTAGQTGGSLPFDWEALLPPLEASNAPLAPATFNFASSRPAEGCFPLCEFRRLAREVIDSPQATEILQLGSSFGYRPLREYLLSKGDQTGITRPGDDLIVTNGCQQALDLLARVLVRDSSSVLVEDPTYGGVLSVFRRAGARPLPVPVGDKGFPLDTLEALLLQYQPRLLVVTPDFQNPTGSTLNLEQRVGILALARRFNLLVVENSIYRDLRYLGEALPSLKQLDETGNTIAIGSYSKVAFPGLRVGWVLGPQPLIARLAEAKQTSDLHSDQLSQAVLLRFAESGELAQHLKQTRRTGAERLRAALEGCERCFPAGTQFTRPQGGMSLWVELPEPLMAENVLLAARRRGVTFLAGPYFSVRKAHKRHLRICFGGLSPADITDGISLLGDAVREQQSVVARGKTPVELMTALV